MCYTVFFDKGEKTVKPKYFLGYKDIEGYYDCFTGERIKFEEEDFTENRNYGKYDTPYVKKAEPLKKVLIDKNIKKLDRRILAEFIRKANELLAEKMKGG